ncbi:hypothetical protein AWB68_08052 [Caballeronia choica]|uniref:Uncharacterized protein n=1 Tax=Caballeronia choica TaxID=326476 RepID=A0A158L1I5_9BURK|nr:hypothetical protein AWB68_08052 [Caballeronia choica]
MISNPNTQAFISALKTSYGASCSGLAGSERRPPSTAAMPIGTLIAKSHGHDATDSTADATVGPAANDSATTIALTDTPRPSIDDG